MTAIHRLLCTHCTFGSSELESNSAENAGKVLGYSVRKSSLPDAERGQLRQVFRAVERLLSYGLPKDATAAHKETLSADTAPRRLIFFPNLGGWQVAAQVSYRTFDTSQPPRPGSYFADLIVAKAPDPRSRDPEPAWSPCDVLQLWAVGHDRKTVAGSDWWISSEDELAAAESDGPWKPLAPTSVAAVREPRPPLIDDAVAHRFLSSDGMAADPLVPARWWAMPAERRRELVAHMLQATILGPARGGRETVTIAAEPSVAAILFYIVCRLLPRRIAAGVSFSTYEPAPERPLTGLVATTFLDEEAPTADLPPELAQRGFACNTFQDVSKYGRCQPPPEQGYARRLVALAAANDWAGIDPLLVALDAEGLKAADLDQLIKIDHLVTAYFNGEKPPGLGGRRGPQEARFLRERFRSVLETQAASRTDWPSDLVEEAIYCLEGDLENLWTAGGPVRALLAKHLPTDDASLERLLKPPQGMPAAPREMLAAAVAGATLGRKSGRLPTTFVEHCAAGAAGRDRQTAAELLKAVILTLPQERWAEALIGDPKKSKKLADLLIDVARDMTELEKASLRPVVTESLAKKLAELVAENPGAAAAFLSRHSKAASLLDVGHQGLQEQLDHLFRVVLSVSDTAPEPGRHLLDDTRRSRVAQLRPWAKHALDCGAISQTLEHWNRLHDSLGRLALNPPAWRSWAKPNPPEGNDLPAAVAAIDGLRPFDPAKRDQQTTFAAKVVKTLKPAAAEKPDLQASWTTVEQWLKQALAEEADRRAPGRAQGASDRSALATCSLRGGIAALIAAVVGLAAYSQGVLDELLRWQGNLEVAAAPKDASKTNAAEPDKPEAGAGSKPVDPAGNTATTGPAGGPAPEPTAPPPSKPAPPPPLTEKDVDLRAIPTGGQISVTWNHEKLKPRIKSFKLTWKKPGDDSENDLNHTNGQADIDTKDGGFGKYEVKLSVSPSDGNGEPFEVDAKPVEIPELPQIQLSESTIETPDGKPCLRVKVTPVADEKRYGQVSHRLTGPEDFSRVATAGGDGTVVFELPESVTPANYSTELIRFTVATLVPQGSSAPVPVCPVQPPDAKQELLKLLEAKRHITALAEKPGDEAEKLCDLPWSLGLDQIEIWLMTPKFKPGMSLTLGPKDTGGKRPRWQCNATVTGDAQELLVGHFEFENSSPWQPRLQFQPAGNKETGHDDAYAALRCCRLCLVIAGQPVATCQLVGQSSLGPLKIQFPVPSKPIEAEMPALQTVPACLPELLLTKSNPEPITVKSLVLSIDFGRPLRFQLQQTKAENAAAAEIKIDDSALMIDSFKPPIKPKKADAVQDKINKAHSRIDTLEEQLAAIKDGPSAESERAKKRGAIGTAQGNRKKFEDELRDLQSWNAFTDAVQQETFTISDWRIAWETNVAADKSTLPTEIPGGTAVVLIQGSAQGAPIEFREQKKRTPAGPLGTDTAPPSGD
jgi:hypothetical protein